MTNDLIIETLNFYIYFLSLSMSKSINHPNKFTNNFYKRIKILKE